MERLGGYIGEKGKEENEVGAGISVQHTNRKKIFYFNFL
jgi:hypothetical protein